MMELTKEELINRLMRPYEMGTDGSVDDKIALTLKRQWFETWERNKLLNLYLSVKASQFGYNDTYGVVLFLN